MDACGKAGKIRGIKEIYQGVKKMNDLAFNIHQEVLNLKRNIETQFLQMGALLKKIRDERLYETLSYETFEEYIAQPELALNRSTVYKIIGVYEDFGMCNRLDIDVAEIGYAKLDRIRQFKDQEDFEEWVYKAKTLSLSDLSLEIREKKGQGVITSEVLHIVCPYCGKEFEYRK